MSTVKQEGQRRQLYFEPGLLRVVAEHSADLSQEQIVAEISQKRLFGDFRSYFSNVDRDRIVTLPHSPSLARLPRIYRSRNQAFSIVPFTLSETVSDEQLINEIENINQQILREPPDDRDSVLAVRVVAPNWLSSPTPENTGGGGPGARPVPASVPDPQNQGIASSSTQAAYKFRLKSMPLFSANVATNPVDVALLDTAYPLDKLHQGYAQFKDTNPLIRSLLQPDAAGGFENLAITYATDMNIRLPAINSIRVEGHDYPMNDHSLFIAGIIHSIAPQARLHIFQVLNEYGIGSIQGIEHALLQIYQQRCAIAPEARMPLVINCSLMIVMPLPGQRQIKANDPVDQLSASPLFTTPPAELNDDQQIMLNWLCIDLEWVCAALRSTGALIVAAAGNDARNGHDAYGGDRPQARFPAAFYSVEGVGALGKDGSSIAAYSNKADRPPYIGLATFGGDIAAPVAGAAASSDHASVEGQSVLGAYIGDFPGNKPAGHEQDVNMAFPLVQNTTGWAWWAGTSFATPVISATAAALMGHGLPPLAAMGAIRGAQAERDADSAEIFSVSQGL